MIFGITDTDISSLTGYGEFDEDNLMFVSHKEYSYYLNNFGKQFQTEY